MAGVTVAFLLICLFKQNVLLYLRLCIEFKTLGNGTDITIPVVIRISIDNTIPITYYHYRMTFSTAAI